MRFFFSFFQCLLAVATVLSVFKLAATIAPAFCFVFFFARSLCVFRLAAPHLSFYGPPPRFPSLRTQEPALVALSRAITKVSSH